MLSVPLELSARDGSGRMNWILFNWLVDDEMNNQYEDTDFDDIWRGIRGERRLLVNMGIVTMVEDDVPSEARNLLAWVERNNGRVPRGLIGFNEEGEEYMMGETLDGQHFRFFISNLRDGESVNFGDGPVQVEFERAPRAAAGVAMPVVMLVSGK